MPRVRRVEKQINDSYENNPEMEIEKDYKNIPLYSESEVKSTIIDDSEEVLNKYIGRQALNGYAGLCKDKWTVGRRGDGIRIICNTCMLRKGI